MSPDLSETEISALFFDIFFLFYFLLNLWSSIFTLISITSFYSFLKLIVDGFQINQPSKTLLIAFGKISYSTS